MCKEGKGRKHVEISSSRLVRMAEFLEVAFAIEYATESLLEVSP